MMKSRRFGYAALAVLFILLSVIVFAVPSEKTGTFWISYVFTALAFAIQLFICKAAFDKGRTWKSKFLGLPIVYIGVAYLIVQVIALAIFVAAPTLPVWSAVIVCAVIIGVPAICMIAGSAGQSEIERVDARVQQKISFIREMQTDVELLADQETNAEIRAALQQLTERIRFSDPMSDDALEEIEKGLATKATELKTSSDKMTVIHELNMLLAERNKKCKILK